MSRLVRLYPRAWRERYLAELEDLLADRPPTVRDRLDIVRGAFDAWVHPQLVARPADPEGGLSGAALFASAAAVIGGGLWIATGLTMYAAPVSRDLGYKEVPAAVIMMAAGMAVTALAAIITARSVAVGSRSAGIAALAMLAGAPLIAIGWPLLIVGFFGYVLATAAFGLILARSPGQAFGGLLAFAALFLPAFNTEDERALISIPFGLAWIAIGSLAFRRVPAATAA
ncbi:MAG TPA: hypothetical protein VFY18_00900 [Candidatus Limnocylindrales bacterium]|nr:hypothetical protein [Candidatus Limnocylindrales bacterium]